MLSRKFLKERVAYVGLLILGALGVLTQGCSTAAMKSTPLWDSEYHETLESGQSPAVLGPVEDRLNVWPVFYYREPALSVLWPLFSKTPEGNALVPFYEWEQKNERLRVGTIHQALFPLANFEKDGWRVANVFDDKEEKTIGIFPVFYKDLDDKWICVPPVFFKDEDIFWSIPWTQRRDENSSFYGVLGPLFWVANNGEYREYRLPAPLTAFWRGKDDAKAMAWPLFNYTREENDKSLNLGWLLYRDKWNDEERELHYLLGLGGVERKGDKSGSWLFPVWSHKREGEKENTLLFPLWYDERDGNKSLSYLFPLFTASSNDDRTSSTLFPIWYAGREGEKSYKTLFPVWFTGQDGNNAYNCIFPVWYAGQDEKSNYKCLFPVWYSGHEGDQYKRWLFPYQQWGEGEYFNRILWPLYFQKHSESTDTRTVLPLFRWKDEKGIRKTLYSPLYSFSNDGSLRNFGMVLFHDRERDGSKYRAALWPLAHWWESSKGRGSALLPLYLYAKTDNEHLFFTPLGGIDRHKNFSLTYILGPAYIDYKNHKTQDEYRTVAFPIFTQWSDGKEHGHRLLPFYKSVTGENKKVFYSFPYSSGYEGDDSFCNLGLFFYHDRDRDGRKYRAALWPLAHWWANPEGEGSALVPLYYHNKTGDGRRIVTPLGASVRDKDKSLTDILGPVYIDYKNLKDDSSYRSVAFPFFHQWKGLNDKGHCLLPLYLSASGDDERDFISLPFSYGHNGDDRYLNIAAILYNHRHDEWDDRVRDRTHLLWPFIEWNNVTGEHPRHGWTFFPLAGYSADEDSKNFMSWLSSWEVSKRSPDERRERLLEIIGDRVRTKIAPEHDKRDEDRWYGANVQTEQSFRYHLPFNLINVRRGLRAQWLGDGQTPPPGVDVAPVEFKVRSQDSETSSVLKTGPVRLDRVSESWVFPLYYSSGIEDMGSDFNILWRLYDSRHVTRDSGDEYVRRRVLWRVMHYEHEAGRTSMDMFPFIAWDKAGDLRKFSFAAGLIEFGREGGKSKMKLLWIPMGF